MIFSSSLITFLLASTMHVGISESPAFLSGIYVTAHTATSKRFEFVLDDLESRKLPLIVFDIQTGGGKLAYDSKLPAVDSLEGGETYYKNLPQFVSTLEERGFYTAARFVLFKQDYLASQKPEWALQDVGGAGPFETSEGSFWLDPSHPELQRYLLDVLEEIVQSGVSEIQFDYVRFPSGGKGASIGYTMYAKDKKREEVITDFVKKASEVLRPYGTKLSLDLFGVIVWNHGFDGRIVGQNVSQLSKYVDVIYPMVYPSHFAPGFNHSPNPVDEPYFFVQRSLELFQQEMAGNRATLRPWLQAFRYRAKNFGKPYVDAQIQAGADLGIHEFALWNAGNNYEGILPDYK